MVVLPSQEAINIQAGNARLSSPSFFSSSSILIFIFSPFLFPKNTKHMISQDAWDRRSLDDRTAFSGTGPRKVEAFAYAEKGSTLTRRNKEGKLTQMIRIMGIGAAAPGEQGKIYAIL
jgi:hypothetical protein